MKDTIYNIKYKYNIQPPCSVSGIKTRWLDIVLYSNRDSFYILSAI